MQSRDYKSYRTRGSLNTVAEVVQCGSGFIKTAESEKIPVFRGWWHWTNGAGVDGRKEQS
ncbi:hypothetical protein J4437_03220 [Candidatus Woesearchaeota archaeon]|nr:hypothetical protein [Candidatus Woesearchaeota archaeon]